MFVYIYYIIIYIIRIILSEIQGTRHNFGIISGVQALPALTD